jgi:hypothetical protein
MVSNGSNAFRIKMSYSLPQFFSKKNIPRTQDYWRCLAVSLQDILWTVQAIQNVKQPVLAQKCGDFGYDLVQQFFILHARMLIIGAPHLMRRFYSKSKQALFIYLSNNDSMKLTELPELAIIFFNYFRLIFLFDEFTSICGWLVSKQKHVWNK